MAGERMFPVLGQGPLSREYERLGVPRFVPWSLLAPHEDWAIRNHDQTLERLAERGGLDMHEMVAVIEGKRWREVKGLTHEQALARLNRHLAAATPASPPHTGGAPHSFEACPLAPDECAECRAIYRRKRTLQPTTPDPTPSSGEGEDPQDCRGCDGRGFTVGGDNEHYPCRACQLPATPSRQKEE